MLAAASPAQQQPDVECQSATGRSGRHLTVGLPLSMLRVAAAFFCIGPAARVMSADAGSGGRSLLVFAGFGDTAGAAHVL